MKARAHAEPSALHKQASKPTSHNTHTHARMVHTCATVCCWLPLVSETRRRRHLVRNKHTQTPMHTNTHQTKQYHQHVQACVCVVEHASSPLSSSCRALYTVLITFTILALYCAHMLVVCTRTASETNNQINMFLPPLPRVGAGNSPTYIVDADLELWLSRRGDHIISNASQHENHRSGQQMGVYNLAPV